MKKFESKLEEMQEILVDQVKKLERLFENGCSPLSSKYLKLEAKIENTKNLIEIFKL